MSDPERNPQFRRQRREPERRNKPPPDADARQRRPATNEPTPVENPRVKEVLNIAGQRDSRMADKLAGTKKHTGGAGRSKSMPRQKRHQAPSFKLVKIGRKLLHPRPRP